MGITNQENTLFLRIGFVLISTLIVLYFLNRLNLTRIGLLFNITGAVFLHLYISPIRTDYNGLVPAVSRYRSFGTIGIVFLVVGFFLMFIGSFF